MAERAGLRNLRTKFSRIVCLLKLILGLSLIFEVHLRTQQCSLMLLQIIRYSSNTESYWRQPEEALVSKL